MYNYTVTKLSSKYICYVSTERILNNDDKIFIFSWNMPLMIPDVRCQLDESPLSSKPHNIIGISKTKEENNKREAI